MDFIYIFFLGASTGILIAIISMLIIGASNSEKYPVGGFIPSFWMIKDLGIPSQFIVAGILIMGGLTGFYLTLTFWKERTDVLKFSNIRKKNNSKKELERNESTKTVKGKSLAKFL